MLLDRIFRSRRYAVLNSYKFFIKTIFSEKFSNAKILTFSRKSDNLTDKWIDHWSIMGGWETVLKEN